jgi:hypothetical protein
MSLETVTEFFAEPGNQARLRRLVQRAVERVHQDTSLRVPRSEADQRDAFAEWLAGHRARLGLSVQAEFRLEFPEIDAHFKNPELVREVVEQQVWPQVEQFLRAYAIRGQAAAWVSKHIGGAAVIGIAEPVGDRWRVPLSAPGQAEDLGQIVLDPDGTVIVSESTTRDQLLEQLRARAVP